MNPGICAQLWGVSVSVATAYTTVVEDSAITAFPTETGSYGISAFDASAAAETTPPDSAITGAANSLKGVAAVAVGIAGVLAAL